MSLIEAFIHGKILLALSLFSIISVLVEIAGYKVLTAIQEVEVSHWIFQSILIPATRTLALVTFILVAYPILFGIEEAPSIGLLLNGGQLRLTSMVNIIFMLSLLMPLIPIFSRWSALVLPVQGIAAATLLFHWLAEKLAETQSLHAIHYWPGWSIVVGILVLAFLTHGIAKYASHHLEKNIDSMINREGSGKIIYRAIVMILQAPVILLYTLSLGEPLR